MNFRLYLAFTLFWSLHSTAAYAENFKFHLLTEPHDLDPQTSSAASGNYLFHSIYRGLFAYSREKGLRPEGAEACKRSALKLTCTLRKIFWSNGTPVTARDYVLSFRRLIDPENKSPQSDVIFNLKNAREIWAGKLKAERLGIEAPLPNILIFHFAQEDPEFEYRLIHSALSPLPPGGYLKREDSAKMPVNGPYKISEWKRGVRVKLEPNDKYAGGNPERPAAEAYFIDEDSTALRLFESGKLNFLRRLVASEFPRFRGTPEFQQIPMARFDYVGFGPALRELPKARYALAHGIEFADFMRLFGALSPAGCPSLPSHYMDRVNCLKPDFAKAKKAAEAGMPAKLEMNFSKMGGDDILRAVEWLQGQWKKNLGWTIELKSQEQTAYVAMLRESPPAIFRKGLSLDRPTCLAALEIFLKGNPENFIALDDPKYERLVDRLRASTGLPARKKACREAVDYLMSLDRLIPLGEIHFTVLASKKFKGWELNELNQLDLSQLTAL